MRGRRRVNDDALIAYLDGKHMAIYLIQKYYEDYDQVKFLTLCREMGYNKHVIEFMKGVLEVYDKKEDVYIATPQDFPNTERKSGICKPTNQVSVTEMWGKMLERYN